MKRLMGNKWKKSELGDNGEMMKKIPIYTDQLSVIINFDRKQTIHSQMICLAVPFMQIASQ